MLATTGSLAAVLLAGCSASGDEQSESNTPQESTTTTTTAEPTTSTTTAPADDGDVEREVTVVTESFTFTPGTDEPLTLKAGETVKLTATAKDDGIGQGHGLGIPKLDVDLQPLYPDEPKSIIFTPAEPGEYTMLCTIQCSQPGAGSGHSDMVGTVVVE